MAKVSTKKPKLTQEEQMAQLARLTGSVAAISHMGTSQPFVLPGAVPAPAAVAVAAPAAPVTEPAAETVEMGAPVAAGQPELSGLVAPSAAVVPGPKPAVPPLPAPDAAPTEPQTAQAPAAAEPAAEDGQDEEEAAVAQPPAARGEGADKPDFTSLFAESSEKKTFQVRITASHQQFFQQMGLLLGGGASSTDVIHNILAQFKAANEGPIQKAFQRQLRQMMSPKK